MNGQIINRLRPILILFGILPSLAAGHKSDNFQVEAPTSEIAKELSEAAERFRKEQALAWLEKELPPWPQPCCIKVKITLNGRGGCSTFSFDKGKVTSRSMVLEGELETLRTSVLPHEI